MIDEPKHLKFNNNQNPNSGFEILKINELFQKMGTDETPNKLHLVEFYMLIFIENGEGQHTIDFKSYECKKGTVLTIRKDQIHKFSNHKNIKGSLLLFTSDFLISYFENQETLKSLQLFNEQLGVPKIQLSEKAFQEMSDIIERINTEYSALDDNFSFSVIRSELHILITKLFRIKTKNKQVVSNNKYLDKFILFQKLVEENVSKTNKVIDYSKLIGVSSKTINTITKNIVRKTAKEFVDEICTKQIKRLLINTELSIKEIAYKMGFEETTNFYKYFKRQTSLTPEKFRELK